MPSRWESTNCAVTHSCFCPLLITYGALQAARPSYCAHRRKNTLLRWKLKLGKVDFYPPCHVYCHRQDLSDMVNRSNVGTQKPHTIFGMSAVIPCSRPIAGSDPLSLRLSMTKPLLSDQPLGRRRHQFLIREERFRDTDDLACKNINVRSPSATSSILSPSKGFSIWIIIDLLRLCEPWTLTSWRPTVCGRMLSEGKPAKAASPRETPSHNPGMSVVHLASRGREVPWCMRSDGKTLVRKLDTRSFRVDYSGIWGRCSRHSLPWWGDVLDLSLIK